jgi:hypothetical protein
VFRSLVKKDAPGDFKSLKRGEISSLAYCAEKLVNGEGLEISIVFDEEFSHFKFKKYFLFHLVFKAVFRGLTV